jgi:hypothetical protein
MVVLLKLLTYGNHHVKRSITILRALSKTAHVADVRNDRQEAANAAGVLRRQGRTAADLAAVYLTR